MDKETDIIFFGANTEQHAGGGRVIARKKSVYTRRDTDSDAHAAFIESEYPFSSRKRYQSEREGEI